MFLEFSQTILKPCYHLKTLFNYFYTDKSNLRKEKTYTNYEYVYIDVLYNS